MPVTPTKKTQQQPLPKQPETSGEEIRLRIAEAAYFRAQQRGFSPGYEVEDWLAAESEIRRAAPKPPA